MSRDWTRLTWHERTWGERVQTVLAVVVVRVPMKDFVRGASTMWPFWLFYAFLVALCLLFPGPRAHSADAPPVPSCHVIRQYIAQFGEVLVMSQARAYLTEEQIMRLRRECAQDKKR